MPKFNCVWCSKPFAPERKRTREHLVPRMIGGEDGDNIEYACQDCNFRRSSITNYLAWQQELEVCSRYFFELTPIQKEIVRKSHRRFLKKWDKMSLIWQLWVMLEKSVLGHSPTEKMPYKKPIFRSMSCD